MSNTQNLRVSQWLPTSAPQGGDGVQVVAAGDPPQTGYSVPVGNTGPAGPQGPQGPAGATGATGAPGPIGGNGPANTLAIGTVTTGAPGSVAAASITGLTPNQILNLTIPRGDVGAQGNPGPTGATGADGATGATGPANSLAMGTVTTGAPGSAAAATITGTPPSQTLSLTIPRGDVGPQGVQGIPGIQGPAGAAATFANPTQLVGLSVKSGSGTDAMYANAAPALDPAIAPTWSGAHIHTGSVDLAGPLKASGVEGIDGQVLSAQGPGLPAVWRTSAGGAIELGWNFSTAVGAANPGSQKMAFNSAVYASVTIITFNSLAMTNFDANTILSLLAAGNRIYIQQRNDSSKACVFQVTGPGTNLTGYWNIPVTLVDSRGAMFPANADLNCVFILAASSASLASPTATIGLTVVNGSATTGMRSDAAPPLSQAIAPTWTEMHVFSKAYTAANTHALALASALPALVWKETDAAANAQKWMTYAQGATLVHTVASDDESTAGNWLVISRTAAAVASLNFGNATNNPTYNFLGTGGVTFNGNCDFKSGSGAINILSPSTADARINFSANAGASTLAYLGQCGQAGALITGAAVGDMAYRVNGKRHLFSVDAGASIGMQLQADASLTVGGNINAVAGRLYLGNWESLTNLGDSYLRINNSSQYTSGIYTPGIFRAAGGVRADTWVSNSDGSKYIGWNSGNTPYGTAYIAGSFGSYVGLCLSDGLNLHLMSNGATGVGLYCYGDTKWLWNRDSSTTMQSQYNVSLFNGSTYFTMTAASFNAASARALKRETGKPTGAAYILSRLRPILYKMLADGDDAIEQGGLISEEVHALCPWLSDGKTIAYDRLSILLLADWQREHCA